MNCLQSGTGSSGRATQCASGSTTDALDDEDDFGGHFSRPPRYIGAPLIMDVTSKVDKCLARLQSLQGTVAVPKVHVSSSASASTLSPIFSRSRSCLHGSPKVHENDKIRIHDVLRWSDDFSGKYKQYRRDKYMRRLSRSKTEVFDEKKDPLDPHGEWKHWSSPAGDVHKVISEILMASQIAKQITSIVNAAIVEAENSSDGSGKRVRRLTKDTATSPMMNPAVQPKSRKVDPLHKFRTFVSADETAKKRSNVGSRKDVLYPKSKQPIPDRYGRRADENEVTLSTAKKMQSRRSPRAAVKEMRAQEDMWSAKDVTNSKSQKPQADLRAAQNMANSKSHQPRGDMWSAKDVTNSKSHPCQANVGAAQDITNSRSHQSRANMGSVEEITNRKSNQSQIDMWAAKLVSNSKSHQPLVDLTHRAKIDVWAAKDGTNSKPQSRAAPWPESKKPRPRSEKQVPYKLRRVRSAKSPPRTLVEKPKLSTTGSKSARSVFLVKQGSRGAQHDADMEPGVVAPFSTTTIFRALPSTSESKPRHQPQPNDTSVLSSRPKESAAVKVHSASESPLSSSATTEIKRCNSSPSASPVITPSRPKGSGEVDQIVPTSAAGPEIEMCNSSPEGFTVVRSTVPESRTCSAASSPQFTIPVMNDSHQQPVRPNPLIGSLRHKFVMEATEIKSRSNSWRMNQAKSSKAVLFSNPAFAPASPKGVRPASEKRQRPVAGTPKSPVRSTSATRRALDRIGRALGGGQRSISPEITRRLSCTRQKLSYVSPRKSLPSLISRLPSRGKRKLSPVPRPRIIRSTSCTRPAPSGGEQLPLPPGRKPQQQLVASVQQRANVTDQTDPKGSPGAASTDSSSYFSLRMLKDVGCNAQEVPFKGSSKGATPDIAPRASMARNNGKAIKCHSNQNWESELGAGGVLSSCRKWVEESAPPAPGGVCRCEKENVEPPPQRILIKENVVATGWEDEAIAPAVLSTSRSRKTDVLFAAGGSHPNTAGEPKSSISGVRRSFSTGRIHSGTSFVKRARDWMRTQTPNRMRRQSPNFDQPRQLQVHRS